MFQALQIFFSYIAWFFQEMTLLTSLIIIISLLIIIFLIGYCVGVLGAGSAHSFWTKLVHFFKRDTPTSFETLAKRDPNGPTIRSSYFKYREQRRRIKHFWQSTAIILGFKILVIILISGVFTKNPLKAQSAVEITDFDDAVAITQGLAATVEGPKQSPESYYFFEKQGEIREEIITGAELQLITENKQETARLDEFQKLSPESPDLKINQESVNVVRIDQEKTSGKKIQELFFKKPFDDAPVDLSLGVSADGEIAPITAQGINESDQLVFSYDYGTFSKSYQSEKITAQFTGNFQVEEIADFDFLEMFEETNPSALPQQETPEAAPAETLPEEPAEAPQEETPQAQPSEEPVAQKIIQFLNALTAKASAQQITDTFIKVKLKSDTKSGFQVFNVNSDGSIDLYEGADLIARSIPQFEYFDDSWRPFVIAKARIAKKEFEDRIKIGIALKTETGETIKLFYEFGFDGADYIKKQTWQIDSQKTVRMRWTIENQKHQFDAAVKDELKNNLEEDGFGEVSDLKIDLSGYKGSTKTAIDENGNINIYFEPDGVEGTLLIDPALWVATTGQSITVQTGGKTQKDFKLVFKSEDAGISEGYKGDGFDFTSNYFSPSNLLTELEQGGFHQIDTTSQIRLIENSSARVVVENVFNLGDQAKVTENWHIYPSGKLYKTTRYEKFAEGEESRIVDEGETAFVAPSMRGYYGGEPPATREAGSYTDYQLIDILDTNPEAMSEFLTSSPAPLTALYGKIAASTQGDENSDGFNEAQGLYEIEGEGASAITSEFQFGKKAHRPIARIHGAYPTDGSSLANHTKVHLPFDNSLINIGTAPLDAISNNGDILYSQGNYGNSADFSSSNSTVAIDSVSALSQEEAVIEFWYRPNYAYNDNVSHELFTNQGNDSNNYIRLEKDANNDLVFHFNDANALDHKTSVSLADDYPFRAREWIHIRAGWSAVEEINNIEININGMPTQEMYVNNQPIATAAWRKDQKLLLGGSSFNGSLDEFFVYDKNFIDEPINNLSVSIDGALLTKTTDYTLDFSSSLSERIVTFLIDIGAGQTVRISQAGTTPDIVKWEIKNFDDTFLYENAKVVKEESAPYVTLVQNSETLLYPASGRITAPVWTGKAQGAYVDELRWSAITSGLYGGIVSKVEVRASDILYEQIALEPQWIVFENAVSPIKAGLPQGQYMQWRITLSSSADMTQTPKLEEFTLVDPAAGGLVGYWKLDETTGGSTAVDSSGSGNNGTPNGTGGANNLPQPSTDVASGFAFTNGRSMDFDGTDDYVALGSPTALQFTNVQPFTVSAWINTNNAASGYRIIVSYSISNLGGYPAWYFFHNTTPASVWNEDSIAFEYYDGGAFVGTYSNANSVPRGGWHHVVVTRTSNTAAGQKFYIDGVNVAQNVRSDSAPASINYTGLLMEIGARAHLCCFANGLIDDVRIYNRALSATEITALASKTHTSATWTGTSSTAWETAGNWDIGAVPDNYTNITIANVANAPILGANIQTANLTTNSSSTLDLSSYTLQFNDSGTFTNNGTLKLQGGNTLTNFTNDTDSGTVEYSGTGTYASLVAGNTYNNLTFSGSGGSWTLGSALDVNALLTLTAGTLDVSSSNYGITAGGGWTDTGAGTFTERSGTVTFDGTGTINSNEAFNNVIVSAGTLTASTNTVQAGGTLTVSGGTLAMNGAQGAIAGLATVSSGTLQAGTATQTFNGGLTVSGGTFTGSTGAVNINGNLTLSSGTFTAPSGTFTVSGNYAKTGGTFTPGSNTVTFNPTNGTSAGLVGYWNLDEGSGTSATDSSGNGNAGTLANSPATPTWATGQLGNGLNFDGTDDYVDVGDSISLEPATTITIAAWIKVVAQGTWTPNNDNLNDYAMTKGRKNGEPYESYGIAWRASDGKFTIAIGTSVIASVQSVSTFAVPTSWVHVAGTYDGANVKIFINGVQEASVAQTGSIAYNLGANPDDGLYIGKWGLNGGVNVPRVMNGSVDDVRIYNRALSAGEVTALYNIGLGTATQTLNSGGTSFNNISHTAAGTLQLVTNPLITLGTFANSAGAFDANSLANTVAGLATLSGGTYSASTATQTFNGGLTVSGGTFTGSTGTTDVNGVLTISSGVFTAPNSSGALTVSGNFDHSGGTFTHNSGTLTLDGGSQSILGSSTFNNLTKNVASSATLTFANGSTQTFVGAMNLKGAASNLLSLRSSVTDSAWRIDPQSTRTIEYLSVKDSNNINATAITTQGLNITDAGGNTGWTFNTDPTSPSSLGSSSLINGSWGNDNTPTLTFTLSDPDGADTLKYRIQIDNDSDFSSPVVDYTSALAAQGSASFTVGQSAGSGTYTTGSAGQTLSDSANAASGYYWRALAIDNTGASSAYTTANSGAIAFKLDTVSPTAGTVSFGDITASSIAIQTTAGSDALSGLTATPYNFQNTTLSTSSGAQSGTSWTNSSLSVNTQYAYNLVITDTAGNTATTSSTSKYTLANAPQAPTLAIVGSNAMDSTINANSNPSITEYAIAVSSDNWLNTNYVQLDGTLGSAGGSGVWQTIASWSVPKQVTGLNSLYTYKAKIKARNGNQTETDFSAEAQLGSLNQAPSIVINSAAQTQNGTQYVVIAYTLTDAESNTCSLANYEYSTDNSLWQTMTEKSGVLSEGTNALSSSANGTVHNFMWNVGADLANTEDPTVYIRLKPNDSVINGSYANSSVFSVDTVSPSISDISVLSIIKSASTVLWTTNEIASSQVEYGTSSNYGSLTAETDTAPKVTAHSVNVNNLTSCAKYYYRVLSKDANGNPVSSIQNNFTTTGCGSSISIISSPNYGASIAGGGADKDTANDQALINEGERYTDKPEVTLNLQSSRAQLMLVSNDLNFTDISFEPFTNSKKWILKDPESLGKKTVYVRFRDQNGSLSKVYESEIELVKSLSPHISFSESSRTPSSAEPGDQITYKIEYQNTGYSKAREAEIRVVNFQDLIFKQADGDLLFSRKELDINERDTFEFTFQIKEPLAASMNEYSIILETSFKDESGIIYKQTQSISATNIASAGIQGQILYAVSPKENKGLGNATVYLFKDLNNNQKLDGADQKMLAAVTDANGKYQFNGLRHGEYLILPYLDANKWRLIRGQSPQPLNLIKGQQQTAVNYVYEQIKINPIIQPVVPKEETKPADKPKVAQEPVKTEKPQYPSLPAPGIEAPVLPKENLPDINLPDVPANQPLPSLLNLLGLKELPSGEISERAFVPTQPTIEQAPLPQYENLLVFNNSLPEKLEETAEAQQQTAPEPVFNLAFKPIVPIGPSDALKSMPKTGELKNLAVAEPETVVFGSVNSTVTVGQTETISQKQKQTQAADPIRFVSGKTYKAVVYPETTAKSVKGVMYFEERLTKKEPRDKLSISSFLVNLVKAQETPADSGGKKWRLAQYDYRDENNDGLWEAEILAPMVSGKYLYSTYIEYEDASKETKEIQAETLIDPEGYVYTETKDGYEKRIKGAVVSLWQFNPTEQTYELWQAKEYSQLNPQLTKDQGEYAFLTPEGIYKLKAEARGFKHFESDTIVAQEGQNIFYNIKLETSADFLSESGLDDLIKILIIIALTLTIIFLISKIFNKNKSARKKLRKSKK